MATCPACQHNVSVLFGSLRASVFVQNLFRAPARRVFACPQCGLNLTMSTSSFIFCQVAFLVIVIPCAIASARLQPVLLDSSSLLQIFSTEFPNLAVVALWILPTLLVTLLIYSQIAKRIVEFQKAAA